MYGVVISYDADMTPIWINNGLVGKQSASSWNGACIYDNLRISVLDVYDGKRLWLSAASATPLNGVYYDSWLHTKNSSGSYINGVDSLTSGSLLYSGNGANRFATQQPQVI